MLYDLAENKLVTDWLRGWGGFKVGLVVAEGDLYDLSMAIHIPVSSFIIASIIWGLLFRHAAGVTWALGIGLVVTIGAGLCAGLSTSLGRGLDWGFGVKSFYFRVDVKPQGNRCVGG